MKTLALIAALLLAAPASADYRLPHPHHERCRAHYERRTRHHRVLCVRVKPPAATPVAPTAQPGSAVAPAPQPAAPAANAPDKQPEPGSCELPSEQAECEAIEREQDENIARAEREEAERKGGA